MTDKVKKLTKQVRLRISRIFDKCYSKDLSICGSHTIFQREKASNLIVEKLIPIIRKAVEEECLKDKIEYGESTYESGYAMVEQEVAKEIKRELIQYLCLDAIARMAGTATSELGIIDQLREYVIVVCDRKCGKDTG